MWVRCSYPLRRCTMAFSSPMCPRLLECSHFCSPRAAFKTLQDVCAAFHHSMLRPHSHIKCEGLRRCVLACCASQALLQGTWTCFHLLSRRNDELIERHDPSCLSLLISSPWRTGVLLKSVHTFDMHQLSLYTTGALLFE